MTDQRSVSSMPGVTLTFVLADGPRGTKFVHESPLGVETSKCCFRRGPAQG